MDDSEGNQLEKPFDAVKLVGIIVGVTVVFATVAVAICCVFCWKKKPRGTNARRTDNNNGIGLETTPAKVKAAEGAAYIVPPPSNGMIAVGNAGQGPTIMVPSIMPQPGQHGPHAGQPMGPRPGQQMGPRPGQQMGPRPGQQMGPRQQGQQVIGHPGMQTGPRPAHQVRPAGPPGVMTPGQPGVPQPTGYNTCPSAAGPTASCTSLPPAAPSVQTDAVQRQGGISRTLPQQKSKYPNLERPRSMQDNRYIKFEVPPPQDTEKSLAPSQTAVDSKLEEMAKLISRAIARTLAAISIDAERIARKDVLGSGQYGVVYKGELANVDKSRSTQVALKTIAGDANDDKDMQDFMEEVLRMKTFSHVNVMPMLGMTIIEDKPYMVLPFMDRGDLRTYISNPKRTFTVEELLRFVLQVAKGMDYLSQQNIIHGDLAARNCMVDQEGSVKVADFGLSRHLFHSNYYSLGGSEQARPIRWMAPECLTDQRYTIKSDVWAYGVLMYEVMTRGHRPYSDIKDNYEVIDKVTKGHRMPCPEYTAPELYEIMAHCWSDDAANRPSFKDLTDTVMLLMEQAGGEYEMPVNKKL